MEDVFFSSDRTSGESIPIGQVTVILGANGTGKSRFLNEIRGSTEALFDGYDPIQIEGGRATEVRDSLLLDRNTFTPYQTLEKAIETHQRKSGRQLSTRVFDALMVLERKGSDLRRRHSVAVSEWQESGGDGPCPTCPAIPLERVFSLFNEVFPRINLAYDESSHALSCKKGEDEYGPSNLSDGEKQCFAILADLVEIADDNSVFFIDEPEQNLNPLLANRLWETIENEFPKAFFVYCTHCVSFAMRNSVKRVHVLSDDNSIYEVEGISDIAFGELPSLLGSIPAILTTATAVATEGRDGSFDGIFYKWLAPSDVGFEAIPVGGCSDVEAVASRAGFWRSISQQFKVMGIVDRDFKSDQQIEHLSESCTVLDLHEAESYLCIAAILESIAHALGTVDPIPSQEDLNARIVEFFSEQKLTICATRVFSRLEHRIGVAAKRQIFKKLSSYETLDTLIKSEVASEVAKVESAFSEIEVAKVFEEERLRCENAINDEDVHTMLVIAPGKELLNRLAPMVGCKNSLAVARAALKHIDPTQHQLVASIRATIETQLR